MARGLTRHPAGGSQLVMEVLKHLDGAYALLCKSSLYPGELVACKRGSPLILGIKTSGATDHRLVRRLRKKEIKKREKILARGPAADTPGCSWSCRYRSPFPCEHHTCVCAPAHSCEFQCSRWYKAL